MYIYTHTFLWYRSDKACKYCRAEKNKKKQFAISESCQQLSWHLINIHRPSIKPLSYMDGLCISSA